MSKVFLNWRGGQGRETVDELDSADFANGKDFRKELNRLCGEYALAGMSVYSSSRMCANWRENE